MADLKISDVLDGAADLIETDGHARGTKNVVEGPGNCVISALSRVGCWGPSYYAASKLVAARVLPDDETETFFLAPWSDAVATDELIETLRKCAAEARWSEVDDA